MKAKEYAVPRAVKPTDSGDRSARKDAAGFYFLLVCGHTVAVPREAESRDCPDCRAEIVAKGLVVPPCPCCKGRGTMIKGSDTTNAKGHRSVTVAKVTCWWCKGRTAPAPTAPAGATS